MNNRVTVLLLGGFLLIVGCNRPPSGQGLPIPATKVEEKTGDAVPNPTSSNTDADMSHKKDRPAPPLQSQDKQKTGEETSPVALLAYREHLPTESTINRTGFSGGRPFTNKGTITKGTGETLDLNRSYAYDANGVGTVTDASKTSHKDPKAPTYTFALKEKVSQLGRTLSVEGKMTSSSGVTYHIQREYEWDVNGVGTVTDTTKTTHLDPKTVTYQYKYVETINQVGQTTGVEGTVTDSRGRVMKVSAK